MAIFSRPVTLFREVFNENWPRSSSAIRDRDRVAIDSVVASRAQDPAATVKLERQKRLDQQFQESLGWYLVSASPASPAPMKGTEFHSAADQPPRGQGGGTDLEFQIWEDDDAPVQVPTEGKNEIR